MSNPANLTESLVTLINSLRKNAEKWRDHPLPTLPIPQQDTSISQLIDHTLLRADASEAEIQLLCEEAKTHHFATVCVNSQWIPLCTRLLKNSLVRPITVVGFPLGASTSATKAFEAQEAIQNGAQEIDMVLAVGLLKSKAYESVFNDIMRVVRASASHPVKVILETALLTDEEKVIACVLSQEAGAHFVKTSTGFSTDGAKIRDIELMRSVVGPHFGVKASGGIRNWEFASQMIQAGANRLGTSAGITLVTEAQGTRLSPAPQKDGSY